jgi:DNA-binding beta-propeller fold protein YncE
MPAIGRQLSEHLGNSVYVINGAAALPAARRTRPAATKPRHRHRHHKPPLESNPSGIAIDRTTHKIYVTNTEDTSVSLINGNTCNGLDSAGGHQTPAKVVVGDYPGPIAVDPAAKTAYIPNAEGVSVIPLHH